MKKLLRLLIFLILFLPPIFMRGQEVIIPADGTVVVLPRNVVEQLYLDAVDKDILIHELSISDSTIRVYETDLAKRKTLLKECVLTVDEYKVMIKVLAQNEQLTKDENKTLKKIIRQLRFSNGWKSIVIVVEFVLIIILVL